MFDRPPPKQTNIEFIMIRFSQIFVSAICAVLLASACSTAKPESSAAEYKPAATMSDSITGYWTVPDPDTNKTDAIVIGYQKDGVFYYRMVAVYDDSGKLTDTAANCTQKAKGIKGNPKMCSFDMIWGLKFDGKKYSGGHIIDPDSGKVYNCEVWYDAAKQSLVVRGELWIFGENMNWYKAENIPNGAKVNPANLTPFTFEK